MTTKPRILVRSGAGRTGSVAVLERLQKGFPVRDLVLLAGANRLGNGLSKDFGRDALMGDALVNGGLAVTERLKSELRDDRGNKLLHATRVVDIEVVFVGK